MGAAGNFSNAWNRLIRGNSQEGNQQMVTQETQLTAFPQNCRSPAMSSNASNAVNTTNTVDNRRCGNCGASVPRSPSLAYTRGFTSTTFCRMGKLFRALQG